MPKGWRIGNVSEGLGSGNTLEINTGNSGGKYHVVSEQDWAELEAGLDRVQAALPAGLYSVHIHNGFEPHNQGKWLDIDTDRANRLIKVFEAMWRALAGMGYRAQAEPTEGATGQVHYIGLNALNPGQSREYKHALGFSSSYPTLETRIITGLLRSGPGGPEQLDSHKLAGNLWWTFALMRALTNYDDFDLVTLGLPVTAGLVPTTKQLLHFADRVYKDDIVGKALALQRLFDFTTADGEPLSGANKIFKETEIRQKYADMGLTLIYRLHTENDGIDENIVERLLGNPELQRQLAHDLANAHRHDSPALQLFPKNIRPTIAEALRVERESRRTDLAKPTQPIDPSFLTPPKSLQVTPDSPRTKSWWSWLAASLGRFIRWLLGL